MICFDNRIKARRLDVPECQMIPLIFQNYRQTFDGVELSQKCGVTRLLATNFIPAAFSNLFSRRVVKDYFLDA